MTIIVQGNEMTLTGAVGARYGFLGEDCFSHGEVIRALAEFDDDEDITIRLNSGGGDAEDGLAIYNALRARSGKTDIIVEGLAASSGAVIAMAGNKVTMMNASLFMVHQTMVTMLDANSEGIEVARRAQEAFDNSFVAVMCRKTGKSDKAMRAYLKPETWFTASEAKAAGFVDAIEGDGFDLAAKAPSFPYQAYSRAPQQLVAMAKARDWKLPSTETPPTRKEPAVSDKTVSASAHATATARIKAIMQAPEAKGRDKLAEHLAFDTTMDAESAVAIMKVAPETPEDDDADLYASMRAEPRLNGQGLTGGGPRRHSGSTDIVAAMRAKHGVK